MAPIQSRITDLTEEASQVELACDVALSAMVGSWLDSSEVLGKKDIKDYDKFARIFLKTKKDEYTCILSPTLLDHHTTLFSRVKGFVQHHITHNDSTDEVVDPSKPYHEQVWHRMISKAKNFRGISYTVQTKQGEPRYKNFLECHDSNELLDLMKQGTHPKIWEDCVVQGKAIDPSYLQVLPEDFLQHRHRGWYLIVLWNKKMKMHEWHRVYVGQVGAGITGKRTVMTRGHEHQTNVWDPNHTEILYMNWRDFRTTFDIDQLRESKIISLGEAPSSEVFSDPQDAALFLNLGEMFFSLIFRSLQIWDLRAWLPGDSDIDETSCTALNVSLPLSQGTKDAKCAYGRLVKSPDPIVAQHCYDQLMQNLSKVHNGDWSANTFALRKMSHMYQNKIYRSRVPGQVVEVKCKKCGWHKTDTKPAFICRTGEYLASSTVCKGNICDTFASIFLPTGAHADISYQYKTSISKRVRKHADWREYYTSQRIDVPVHLLPEDFGENNWREDGAEYDQAPRKKQKV